MARNYSKKREAILEKICSTTSHPSAEWVYRELKDDYPDLSLGTVYRNINLFRDEGRIISVGTVDGQERFDGATHRHAHFICSQCKAVIDVETPVDDLQLDSDLEDSLGVRVDRVDLTVYGTCSACLEGE